MKLRRGLMAGLVFCLGCQLVGLSEDVGEDEVEDGGHNAGGRVIGFFEPVLTGQSGATGSHLSRAAVYLEKGDEPAACAELACYLADHPAHFEVRVHFAELLLHQQRLAQARTEFTRAIAVAQELGDKTVFQRLHCHGMLKDIAEAQDDDYAYHLHRGIGLYLLAQQRAKLPDPDDTLPVEGLLCRAAAELALARGERPGEAQPCWYLHLVWSALGQEGPTIKWLHRAAAAAPFSYLSPAEHRGLQLALIPKAVTGH